MADNRGQEAQALVKDGIIYLTDHEKTVALDALSGKQIWKSVIEYPPDTTRVVFSADCAKNAATMRVDAKAAKPRKKAPKSQSRQGRKTDPPRRRHPQIAKGEGDAPVQAYIAAMPGWKRDVGRRLDALIVRTVPGVRKAVKWNSPFYSLEGQGWFLGVHCFTKYVKVAFFRGASLQVRGFLR
jgi:Domain of unknown function (DU1801)